MNKKITVVCILLLLIGYALGRKTLSAQELPQIEESLKKSVAFLASDSLQGRKMGSEGEKIAAQFIYDELVKNGVTMISPRQGEDFFYVKAPGDTLRSANVIGIVEGYDSNLKNEYIVIGAHYDHLGVNVLNNSGREEKQIYYGADDNASGVAVALEVAKFIEINKFMFKRSVIFTFFGAEEAGMAGSWYFVNRSFSEIDNVIMMINLDMVGRSGGDNKMQVFTIGQNVEIKNLIGKVSSRTASLIPIMSATDYFPSDHLSFYEKGIPVTLFTTGLHRDYHSKRDTPEKLDYKQMAQLSEYVYAFSQMIADMPQRPVKSVTTKEIITEKGKEIIYTQQDVDKKAKFLHGDERQFLEKWVYQYLKYPEKAIEEGVSGKVILEFIVDAKGAVRDVTVLRGVSEELDAEAVKVVEASPKWKAAEYKGVPVSVKMSIPVEFKISTKSEFKIKR